MLRTVAILFGIFFLMSGILGYLPEYTPGGHLFGYFLINPAHNIVHLVTGIVALWVGATSLEASKIFFRIFGVIYFIVAILGIYYGDQPILGMIANNMADVGLHLVIAIIALYLGFRSEKTQKA